MLGIPLGILAANGAEWWIHKHILHGVGRDRKSWWSFHFHEHHSACRKHDYRDPHYERPVFGQHSQGKEALGLVGLGLAFAPLFPVAPFFVGTLWTWGVVYHRLHKQSHLHPEWGRETLPWHYDHHMGPNPDANWCVTVPIWDHLMGTREPYKGTPREAADLERKAARRARAAEARAAAAAAPVTA